MTDAELVGKLAAEVDTLKSALDALGIVVGVQDASAHYDALYARLVQLQMAEAALASRRPTGA